MIEEPKLLQIRRSFPRPDAALVARFAGVPTGFLADCMDGRGALAPRIKPVDPAQASFAGVAVTCQAGPGDNLAITAALPFLSEGDVLVAAVDGFLDLAVVGDRVAGMIRNRGGIALVTDGAVRDTPGIRATGLPVFAAGVTPASCTAAGPGTVGLPVVLAGIAVAPGDVVVGDCDGVVVVPQGRIAEVLERLARVRALEEGADAKVAAGQGVPERITRLLASDQVRYLD
jgi:4-hydroxy-4-methyl-2-oxoglutarate aldolase